MTDYTMTIAGEPTRGVERFGVINPATGEPFAEAPACNETELDRAMESAELAFRSWRLDESARREALRAAGARLAERSGEVARLLTMEQGKPLAQATREVMSACALFQLTAGLEIPVEVVEETEQARVEVRRKPFGVVAAITPWNYPVLLAVGKLAPALLAGNTVVLKPSPFTPLSTLLLGSILRDIFPPGALNIVSGGDDLGRRISEHPAVRKISFTGSVATGKKVAASAAADLKRVTLELGGNDPAIVLGDVDPTKVAKRLFWGAFTNSGQVCTAIKRIYADERIFRPLVDAIAEVAKSTKVGDGLEPDVKLGPINNGPQHRRVIELVDDAKRRGARVHAGGGVGREPGYFFEPTVVTDVDDDARLVSEEQFGPALPLLPFADLEEAIDRANATHFGLSASVWTNDTERGESIATEIDCGTAWVNQHLALTPFAPFGGSKSSGIGYENGRWGLEGFCQLQVVNSRKA